ncbi:MAG: hypothetical protein FWE23_11095 [Chitinivibrionia bacterium]|nr:hypothetical protein [Chitinivibrionia bacterium]
MFVFFLCGIFAAATPLFAQNLDAQTQQLVDRHIRNGRAEANDERAIAHFTNALELAPRRGDIHILIGDRQKNLNQTDLALGSFRNGVRFGGDTTHAMFQQAEILKELSLKDGLNVNLAVEAARRYRDVYLRDPSHLQAVKNRGILLFFLAENSRNDEVASRRLANEAIIMLEKYLETNRNDRDARNYSNRARALLGNT